MYKKKLIVYPSGELRKRQTSFGWGPIPPATQAKTLFVKCFTQFAISTDLSEFGSNSLYFLFMLGGVEPGDQLLNVEGISLLGINVQQAHEELNRAMSRSSVGCVLPIVSDTSSFVPCVVIYCGKEKYELEE